MSGALLFGAPLHKVLQEEDSEGWCPDWELAKPASEKHDCSRGITDVNSLLTLSMSNASLAKKADFK